MAQGTAFIAIKSTHTAPLLAFHNPKKAISVSADLSAYELAAVLLQGQSPAGLQVITYASCSLSPAELQYAHNEEKLLPPHGLVRDSTTSFWGEHSR